MVMRTVLRGIPIFVLLVRGAMPVYAQEAAPAAQPPVRIEVTARASSAYVWRGFTIGDRAVLQPSVAVSRGGLTVSSWGNVWHASGVRTLSEHDLTVEYGRSFGRVVVSAGWVNYYFRGPAAGSHSNELYTRVDLGWHLKPSVAVYHDFQAASGTYVGLGVEQALGRLGPLHVTGAAVLGYNDRSWTETSGLSDAAVSLRADWQITPHVRLAPIVTGSRALKAAIGHSRVVWGLEARLR
jgi:hypothetical protein